jgi:hypothetical protein
MDGTRIERGRRELRTPTPVLRRQPAPPPPPVDLDVWPIVLACAVLAREGAAQLLEGLRAADALEAQRLLEDFQALDSSRRQARLAVEFGERQDAEGRLRLLLEEAPAPLRAELLARLPPYLRRPFGTLPPLPEAAERPALFTRLAERLVREATR